MGCGRGLTGSGKVGLRDTESERRSIHCFHQIPTGVYFQTKLRSAELEALSPSKETILRIQELDANPEGPGNGEGIVPSSKR